MNLYASKGNNFDYSSYDFRETRDDVLFLFSVLDFSVQITEVKYSKKKISEVKV